LKPAAAYKGQKHCQEVMISIEPATTMAAGSNPELRIDSANPSQTRIDLSNLLISPVFTFNTIPVYSVSRIIIW